MAHWEGPLEWSAQSRGGVGSSTSRHGCVGTPRSRERREVIWLDALRARRRTGRQRRLRPTAFQTLLDGFKPLTELGGVCPVFRVDLPADSALALNRAANRV